MAPVLAQGRFFKADLTWYISTVAFARWDPIRDLLAIQQRLERYAPGPAGWKPAVDIRETSD